MRKLLFSIPGVYKTYIIARAIFALIGVCVVVYLGETANFRALTGPQIAINYVLFCIWGVIFFLTVKWSVKSRLRNREQLFNIEKNGDVKYHDIQPEDVKVDWKNLTEGRISSLLSTYNSNKYKGKEWNKFRTDLLSARKPYKAGQTINF